MKTLIAVLLAVAVSPGLAVAQEVGDIAAGQAFAKRVCADCHAVLRGDIDSPVIDAPSFSEVANTPGITGRALVVWLQSSHPTMPNLILEPDDRDDVVAYVLSLKEAGK